MRFSIRDVLLLTAVVGLTVGWLLDHRSLQQRHDKRSEYIQRLKLAAGAWLGENVRMRELLYESGIQKGYAFKIVKLPDDLRDEPK